MPVRKFFSGNFIPIFWNAALCLSFYPPGTGWEKILNKFFKTKISLNYFLLSSYCISFPWHKMYCENTAVSILHKGGQPRYIRLPCPAPHCPTLPSPGGGPCPALPCPTHPSPALPHKDTEVTQSDRIPQYSVFNSPLTPAPAEYNYSCQYCNWVPEGRYYIWLPKTRVFQMFWTWPGNVLRKPFTTLGTQSFCGWAGWKQLTELEEDEEEDLSCNLGGHTHIETNRFPTLYLSPPRREMGWEKSWTSNRRVNGSSKLGDVSWGSQEAVGIIAGRERDKGSSGDRRQSGFQVRAGAEGFNWGTGRLGVGSHTLQD